MKLYYNIPRLQNRYKSFTLAEVLITIGIIGIVAAMTLPSLIADAQKKAVASKVHKFYNMINTSVQYSVAEYGDVTEWMGTAKSATYEENLQFFQKYFGKHIKYNKLDNCFENAVCVYMQTGGMFFFRYDANGGDIFYFVNGKPEPNNRNRFGFQFNKIEGSDEDGNVISRTLNKKTTVEPYAYQWNGDYEKLTTHETRGCRKNNESKYGCYCTKILQLNNWQFPKDYPW